MFDFLFKPKAPDTTQDDDFAHDMECADRADFLEFQAIRRHMIKSAYDQLNAFAKEKGLV